MFTKSGTWVDPQGNEFTDAVFKIAQATFNTSNQSLIDTSGGYSESVVVSTKTNNLSYQMLYWGNEQALADDLPPYPLLNVDNLENSDPAMMQNGQEEKIWFTASNLDSTYDGLTAELAAEKHCQDNIL